jgi:protein TonB
MNKRKSGCFIAVVAGVIMGCGGPDEPGLLDRLLDRDPLPDSLPIMLNTEPPFRYPSELYAQRVQGNVSLRLYIDSAGTVVPESTTVRESSGSPVLDSAATAGARDLKFSPATRRGKPMAVSIIYPVYFRHPEATPLPGDTLLRKKGRDGGPDDQDADPAKSDFGDDEFGE